MTAQLSKASLRRSLPRPRRAPGPWLGWISACCVSFGWAAPASGQTGAGESVEERLDRMERENAELKRRLDILGREFERVQLGDVFPAIGETYYGLGPASSKVYGADGLSIGGYGEAIYSNFDSERDDGSPGATDTFDFTRAVVYVGYKFDEKWVFNSEIEVEHADEIFLEFAYLDYLHSPELNARGGLLLVPMGFINELHEPTTFYSVNRPETEQRIIPTTWRENGLGVHGDAGPVSYRAYVVNGFDGAGFDDSGLRGGRQKGSRTLAEDLAVVARADWTDTPGLLAGVSAYQGDAGQGQTIAADPVTGAPGGSIAGLGVTIVEAHAEYRWEALRLRGLFASATTDGEAAFNAATGAGLASELEGWYVEAGYDVLAGAEGDAALTPFVRYEDIDTQADVPAGTVANAARDRELLTFGVAWQPIPNVVLKLDYQAEDNAAGSGQDQLNLGIGYIF